MTVSPSGTVTFRYDYRFNGRRETLAIGRYGPGGISPAMARELLLEARAKPFSRVYRLHWKSSARNDGWTPDLRRGDVSGIKRHIAMDTQGLPHAVTTTSITGCKGALQAMTRCKPHLAKVQSVLADSGHVGRPFAQGIQTILGEHVTVQTARRSELHTFKLMPQRWVVERSFAWLEKNRRLWKNAECKLDTSLQLIHLAFLHCCSKDRGNHRRRIR